MKWYLDEKLIKQSIKHDETMDNGDIHGIYSVIDESIKLSDDEALHPLIRAKYYYMIGTSYYKLVYLQNDGKSIEEKISKSLYFHTESINIQNQYSINHKIMSDEEYYYNQILLNQSRVNYSNILSGLGRLPSAIESIFQTANNGFGMGIANLGEYLVHYADLDYDYGHKLMLYLESFNLYKSALNSKDNSIYDDARKHYELRMDSIKTILNSVSYEFSDTIESFIDQEPLDWDNPSIPEEDRYRDWKVKNSLVLNTLNDYNKSSERSNDILHLPNIKEPLKFITPIFHGLFNLIKQEYCSARYNIFDGIYNKKLHFSDKDIYIVNTLDYSINNINIEKVKSAYKSVYSIFDKIAYFLNEYYELGIPRRNVNFNNLWREQITINKKKINNPIKKYMDSNYILRGLYWIKKDLYNDDTYGYKGLVNTRLNTAYNIRNNMEHQYLKILDEEFDPIYNPENEIASMIVSRDEFEELSIVLLKTVREAIIMLVQSIYINEKNNNDKDSMPIVLQNIEDDWKI